MPRRPLSYNAYWRAVLVVLIACRAATTLGWGFDRAPVRDPERHIQRYVCSYKEIQEYHVVMQKRDYSCGAAALATVIRYYWGDAATEEEFLKIMVKLLKPEELKDRMENGLALTDLKNLANKAGYEASMGTVKFEELLQAKAPVIVGIIYNGHEHFVVYRGAAGGWVYLADSIRGNVRVGETEFQRQWQKNAVLVVAKPGDKVKEVSPLAPRYQEVYRGWLNNQYVRQNALMPRPPNPLMLPP